MSIEERVDHLEERCDGGCGSKVPFYIIGTILLQTFGAVWWASDIDSSLEQLKANTINQTEVENLISKRESTYMTMDGKRHLSMNSRMVKVEENFKYISKSLERIEDKLDGREMD